MCDKAVNTYPSTIKLVPEPFMTPKMCDKVCEQTMIKLILFLSFVTLNLYKIDIAIDKYYDNFII